MSFAKFWSKLRSGGGSRGEKRGGGVARDIAKQRARQQKELEGRKFLGIRLGRKNSRDMVVSGRGNGQQAASQRLAAAWKPGSRGTGLPRGNQFSQERKRQLRQNKILAVWQFVRRHSRVFTVLVVVLGLVLGGAGLSRLFEQTNYLEIKEIEVSGVEQLSSEEINKQLEQYRGRSLYSVDATLIEYELVNSFPFLKTAFVRKILPDRLEVEVQERFPVFSYMNIAGAYLVDEEGVIARVLLYEESNELSTEELAIIEGYIDPNSERIQSRYYEQWEQKQEAIEEEVGSEGGLPVNSDDEEPEEARPEWEDVPAEDKQAIIDELSQEYRSRVDTRLQKHQELINALGLDLINLTDLTVRGYSEAEEFSREQFEFFQVIKEFLEEGGYKIREIQWRTDFKIVVYLDSGTQILFTTVDKNLDLQLLELSAVEQVEAINSKNGIDLRSGKVAVW